MLSKVRKEGRKEFEFESDTVLLLVIITICRMKSYRRSIAPMVTLHRSACLQNPKGAPTQQFPWSSIVVLGWAQQSRTEIELSMYSSH